MKTFLTPVSRKYYIYYYLRRRLANEGVVLLGVTLSRCVYPPSCLYHVSTARRCSLGGEGNALYPVLSTLLTNTKCYVWATSASAGIRCRTNR